MKSSIDIIKNIIKNWKLSQSLARNDFKMKFAGSYLGVVWAFIQPVVTVLVYWFVFQVGLRRGTVGEYPYVIYLVAGLMPWFFIADSLSGGATAFTDYSYLVKQVVFNISILPFVKIVSAFYVHIFFALVTLIILALYGFMPDVYDLQIVYYMFCSFVLVLGLSYLFSSMVVSARDVKQIIILLHNRRIQICASLQEFILEFVTSQDSLLLGSDHTSVYVRSESLQEIKA